MRNIYIIGVISFFLISCKQQTKQSVFKNNDLIKIDSVPKLTYKQMLEDHDSLVSYINQVSPVIYFNKEVRDIDFNLYAKKLKQKINTKTSMPEYLNIVQRTVNSAQDMHTTIIWPELAEIIKNYWLPDGIKIVNHDSLAFNYVKKYDTYFSKAFYTKLHLDLIYTSGEYHNLLPFSYNGKDYPSSMKLLSCNNKNIHELVKLMLEFTTASKWDRVNDRVYKEDFYRSPYIYIKDSIKLIFNDQKDKIHTLYIAKNDTVTFLKKKKTNFGYNTDNSTLTSLYFKKESIFYAKLPNMQVQLGDSISNQLKNIIKNNRVNAIILDIRGNGGGSDVTYGKILKKIIKKPLQLNIKVGRNFSYINRKIYKINNDSIKNNPSYSFKIDSVATLNSTKMYYTSYNNYNFVIPDSIQYPFNGKIYILQDRFIYSSSSNLSNLAYRSKQLVSIGETPDLLGGLQANVMPLCLPHSKILIRIEPQIDFTNTKTKADIFQNNVDYLVNYPIDFLYERAITDKNVFGKDFLYHKDPMFKKVLELERTRKK